MIEAKVHGIPDLAAKLQAMPRTLRKRVLQDALKDGASVVRARVREILAPRDLKPLDPAVLRGRRGSGTVRRAVSVRISRRDRRAGDVGVFVNVRPAKGAARGATRPTDPYYWRWLNYGWNPAAGPQRNSKQAKRARRKLNRLNQRGLRPKVHSGLRFLEAGAQQLGRALSIIMPKLVSAVRAFDRPGGGAT